MSPAEAAQVVPAATFFFRFFAIQVVLYGAGSIISGLLNSQRQYFWPAIGPVFNNVVAIGAMLAFVALGGKRHRRRAHLRARRRSCSPSAPHSPCS